MSIVFSLFAAFLAILVQQWVRNYMHVFQRYGDPLKSARLRQYLYEGCEGWYMPMVAEAVPGFLHISLFLFFAGLGNSLLNINTKVALSTIVPIAISGLLYILITFVPIIYPQSPYRNPFSGVIWYLFQKIHGRRFRERGPDGGTKPVDANMAQGQMELAIEETMARKDRDVRAIRWLIDNLTEDAEMEKFLSAIPGSFNTDWGMEVWRRVGEHHECKDQSQDRPVVGPHRDTTVTAHQPSSSWSIRSVLTPIIHLVRKPSPHHPSSHATTFSPVPPNVHTHSTTAHIRENVVHELSTRVARSIEICKNRKLFSNNSLWQKRTRACIEATASLVCCANTKLAWFGDISELLGDIGSFEKIRELSLAGTDQLFVIRWTCLSLMAIRRTLDDNKEVQMRAGEAMKSFARVDIGNDDALTGAQKVGETLQKAKDRLLRLYDALRWTDDLTADEITGILCGHESQIADLEQMNTEANRLKLVDFGISLVQNTINDSSHKITCQIPGVLDNLDRVSTSFSRFVEVFHDPRRLQFICPGQTLKGMLSPATTLRNLFQEKWDADVYKELLNNLENFHYSSGWQEDQMQLQLWHLQDLRDGGGLGFTVELFFLALSLLSVSSSKESHSALYTGTFLAITSDWSKHKHSLGTQKLLLHIATSRRKEFDSHYPSNIVDEFLVLIHNIFEGQEGSHIDKAMEKLAPPLSFEGNRFEDRLLKVIRH